MPDIILLRNKIEILTRKRTFTIKFDSNECSIFNLNSQRDWTPKKLTHQFVFKFNKIGQKLAEQFSWKKKNVEKGKDRKHQPLNKIAGLWVTMLWLLINPTLNSITQCILYIDNPGGQERMWKIIIINLSLWSWRISHCCPVCFLSYGISKMSIIELFQILIKLCLVNVSNVGVRSTSYNKFGQTNWNRRQVLAQF